MKKLLCLALALMMALTLFGCRAETAATEAPAEETPAEAPAEAPAEEATEAPVEGEAEATVEPYKIGIITGTVSQGE